MANRINGLGVVNSVNGSMLGVVAKGNQLWLEVYGDHMIQNGSQVCFHGDFFVQKSQNGAPFVLIKTTATAIVPVGFNGEGYADVCLSGGIVRDPEMRQTQSGSVGKTAIAVSFYNFEKKDQDVFYINASIFGLKIPLSKGDAVEMHGSLNISNYTTQNGEARTDVSITSNKINYAPRGKRKDNAAGQQPAGNPTYGAPAGQAPAAPAAPQQSAGNPTYGAPAGQAPAAPTAPAAPQQPAGNPTYGAPAGQPQAPAAPQQSAGSPAGQAPAAQQQPAGNPTYGAPTGQAPAAPQAPANQAPAIPEIDINEDEIPF